MFMLDKLAKDAINFIIEKSFLMPHMRQKCTYNLSDP